MKRKILLVVGMFLFFTVSAAYAKDAIQAVLFPVSYSINDETKELPEGQVTFNYNSRAYAPVRFIAESLGARVDFDAENRTIMIHNSNVFTASSINIGDHVAGMEVVGLDLSESDGTLYGSVQFSGEALIKGTYTYTKDDEMSGENLFFQADASSARLLPRMSHDSRDPIFVFANMEDAKKLFGIAGEDSDHLTGNAVVEIDNFTIHYQEKEIYNRAQIKNVYLPVPDLTPREESATNQGTAAFFRISR
jgi:hypothetical protein